MAVNKVIYGGNTLVDLTGDTVTAADLADGVKATGADGNPVIGLMQKVTIDAELSTTSTNPVQNKVITTALDEKMDITGGESGTISFNAETSVGKRTYIGYGRCFNGSHGVLLSIVNSDGSSNGIVTYKGAEIATTSGGTVFETLTIKKETYLSSTISGIIDKPLTSVAHYTVTGAFTLDLSELSRLLSDNKSTVFTAYFTSSADYTLSITNAGTIKYVGSASDVAITSAGLLLNILITRDTNDNVTSIVQASKLS